MVVTDDAVAEAEETIEVGLSYIAGNVAINGASNSAAVTIADNDSASVELSGPTLVAESDGTLTYTLTMSEPTGVDVVVEVQTLNGTATSPSDFAGGTQLVTISSNTISAPSATFTIVVEDDDVVEGTEVFSVSLTSITDAGGASITIDSSLDTVETSITDNDVMTYSISDVTVGEGASPGNFVISVDTVAQDDVTFTLAFAGGTATAGLDYVVPATTVILPAGSSAVNVPVVIVDDNTVELDETLNVSITGVSGTGSFSPGAPTAATMTIEDNDSAVVNVSALTPNVTEPATGTTTNNFSLVMTSPSSEAVTVEVTLTGTALAGSDYTLTDTRTVVFAPNQQLASLQVEVNADAIVEGTETVIATVTDITGLTSGAVTGGTSATMSIIDEDSASVTLTSGTESQTVTEGQTASFTLVQSAPASTDTEISYAVIFGTASSADLSSTIDGVATIVAGSTEAVFSVGTVDDGVLESAETFTVSLTKLASDPSVSLNTPAGTVTIQDNEVGELTLSGSITSLVEEDADLTYTVALSGPSEVDVVVVVQTADGTAAAPGDFDVVNQTLTLVANATAAPSATFTVSVNEDSLVEAEETFNVSLTAINDDGDASVTIDGSNDNLVVTITDDDSTELSVTGPATVAEGAGTVDFTISLSQPAEVPIVVNYGTFGMTATAGNDYDGINFGSAPVTFTVGQTAAVIPVTILDDIIDEADEPFAFRANVNDANGASVSLATPLVSGRTSTSVTIVDNDDSTISLSGPSMVNEADGFATYTITRTPSSADVTVTYATSDGTAVDVDDYTAVSGSVVIPGSANSTLDATATFTVAINNDTDIESTETFSVSLTSIDGGNSATLGTDLVETSIIDNDSTSINVSGPSSVTEGTSAVFTLALSTSVAVDTVVSYSTVDGTATEPSDFTAVTGSVMIAAGDTSATVTVATVDDSVAETDEVFSLSITGVDSSASIATGTATATVTIVDNDVATVSVQKIVDGGETSVGPIGITGRFRISLSNPVDEDTTVTFATLTGSATESTDYQSVGTIAVIPEGQTTVNVDIVPINDSVVEGAETVVLTLSASTNSASPSVTTNLTPATLTIVDNDSSVLTVTGGSVSESVGTADFTLSLSSPSATDTTIEYSLAGSASPGGVDYTDTVGGSTVIPAGSTSVLIPITIVDDLLVEGTEDIQLEITSVNTPVTGLGASGTIEIADDDSAEVQVIPLSPSVGEASNAGYLVYLDTVAAADTTVTVNLSGDAAAGVDYIGGTVRTVVIPANAISANLVIDVIDDSLVEPNETLVATVTGVTGTGSISLGTALAGTVTIVDNDSATVSISDVTVTEGTGGINQATLIITQSSLASEDTTVTFSVADSTAEATLDYVAPAATIAVISAGLSTAPVVFDIVTDNIVEIDETFDVTLTGVDGLAGVGLGTTAAQVTIVNDDSAELTIQASASVTEGDAGLTPVLLTISLSNPSATATTVTLSTADGTATNTLDYVGNNGSVDTSGAPASIAITSTDESPSGLVDFRISAPQSGTLSFDWNYETTDIDGPEFDPFGYVLNGTFVLLTNNAGPDIQSGSVSIVISSGDTFAFRKLATDGIEGSATTIITNFELDALIGFDGPFAPANWEVVRSTGPLVIIPAGETIGVYQVAVVGDTLVEATEDFQVSLLDYSGLPAISLGAANEATVTIIDDDAASVTITNPDVTVIEGGVASLTLSQSAVAAVDTVISYTFQPGLAGPTGAVASDVTLASGLATITAGATETVIAVQTVDDSLVELDETFTISLSKQSGDPEVAVTSSAATVTIDDNDESFLRIFASNGAFTQSVSEDVGNTDLFFLSLSNVVSTPTTVTYSVGGTADPGTDYVAIPTTAIIPAGSTTLPIAVAVTDDTIVENTEDIALTLTGTSNTGVVINLSLNDVASTSILDNDGTATISASATAATITEGAPSGFLISLSNATGLPTTVTYDLLPSIMLTTEDYTGITLGTGLIAVIPAGDTSALITFGTVDDTLVEEDEFLSITLTGATGVSAISLDTTAATVTIQDNDEADLAIVALKDATEAGVDGIFRILMTNPADSDTVVSYSIDAGASTADEVDDFASLTGIATITAGSKFTEITIDAVDDLLVEGNESVVVVITSIISADPQVNLVPSMNDVATLSIIDDDASTVTISGATVSEDDDYAVLTLTLSNAAVSPIEVAFAVNDGTAVKPGDMMDPATLTASFAIGATLATVSIPIVDDSLVEGTEDFTVSLTSIASGPGTLVSGTQGTVTIQDNDDDAVVTISGGSATEGGAIPFTVSLSKMADEPTTVTFAVGGGSATDVDDYTSPVTTSVVVDANTATATFTVDSVEDTLVEGDETIEATLMGVSGDYAASYSLSGTAATATILDDDATTVSITATTPAADEDGPVNGVFQVEITGDSDVDRTVHYSVSGSADEGSDYTGIGTSVVVPAGSTTAEVTVAVTDDSENELQEDVVVTLESVSTVTDPSLTFATVSGTPATVTIEDNDLPFVTVDFSAATVTEGSATTLNFLLDKPANEEFTLTYTLGGSADLTDDISPAQTVTGTIVVPTSATVVPVVLTAVDDTFVEGDETLTVTLTDINGATTLPAAIGATSTATLTIADNDEAFLTVVKTQDGQDPAGAGPVQNGQFFINLTQPSQTDTVIEYSVGGNALPGDDYAGLNGTVTIVAGETEAFLSVMVFNDSIVESNETVILTLETITSGNSAIQIVTTGNETATVTIQDLDTAEITIDNTPTSVTEGRDAVFQISMSNPADTPTTVTLNAAGTATPGLDYTGMVSSVVIPAGSTSIDVTVSTVDDTFAEGDETVILDVASTPALYAGRLTASTTDATLTIVDTDTLVVESVVINDGDIQRSRVTEMELVFNGVVDSTAGNESLFQLENLTDSTFAGLTFAWDYSTPGKTKVTLTFIGAGAANGSLLDGNYKLTVASGLTYDGGTLASAFEYGGTPGDDMYRLFGDIDGSRFVGVADFSAFLSSYGSTTSDAAFVEGFDVDDSGFIGFADFSAFIGNYGKVL